MSALKSIEFLMLNIEKKKERKFYLGRFASRGHVFDV